ncbi:MAG: hypothetical protein MK081_15080 [Flavobacteriales bacterium]|nr:hypothetical protein [Flavobacteriales bacterium]
MNKRSFWIVALVAVCLSCNKYDNPILNNNKTQGYKMLLIGNSFFRPYAEKLDGLAVGAGFIRHESIRITRGGDNGRPINFWNDSLTQEHADIKAALDQGDIDVFGMTAGHDPDNRISGHRSWIEYAIERNPEINIFIAIPQIDFPAKWDSLAEANGFNAIDDYYEYAISHIIHDSLVDPLRSEFPSTKIFTIPTGWTSFELAQMKEDNELLDSITYFGPKATSLFTDDKGHQGDIIEEAGSLVWLSSLYKVDLTSHDYQTGFNTDLHDIAQGVTESHDPNYGF